MLVIRVRLFFCLEDILGFLIKGKKKRPRTVFILFTQMFRLYRFGLLLDDGGGYVFEYESIGRHFIQTRGEEERKITINK